MGFLAAIVKGRASTARRVLRICVFLLILHAAIYGLTEVLPSAVTRMLGPWVANEQFLEFQRGRLPTERGYLADIRATATGDFGRNVAGIEVRTILRPRLLRSLPSVAFALLLAAVGTIVLLLLIPIGRSRIARGSDFVLRCASLFPPFFLSLCVVAVSDLAIGGLNSEGGKILLMSVGAALPTTAALLTALVPVLNELMASGVATVYRAKGMDDLMIRKRFVRNLIHESVPLLPNTILGIVLSTLAAEIVLDWPGFGRLLAEALHSGDQVVLRIWLLLVGIVVLSLSLAWPLSPPKGTP